MLWAFPDLAGFRPADPDAVVFVTDVEGSTRRVVETGDYRDITFTATAGLVAAENCAGDLPGVFTGDGCVVVARPDQDAVVGAALTALAVWARNNLGFSVRVARIPVRRLQAPLLIASEAIGGDRPGPARQWHLLGGGLLEADRLAKHTAALRLPPTGSGAPDLTGLSCRWDPMRTTRGELLAILVEARETDPSAVHRTLGALFARIAAAAAPDEQLWPVRPERMRFGWPPRGLGLECAAREPYPGLRRSLLRLKLLALTAAAGVAIRSGLPPARAYVESLRRNAIAIQVIDGLAMIIDCTAEQHAAVRDLLEAERAAGRVFYGTAASEQAHMSCVVRGMEHHRHFLDTAVGGHWRASQELKRQRAEAAGC